MDNAGKRRLKSLLIIPSMLLLMVAVIPFLGIELPFFNHYNPLYTPYLWLFLGIIIYVFRSRIKDTVKTIWNTAMFFNSAGLPANEGVIDLKPEDMHPIYNEFTREDGTRGAYKHHHPFVIPSEDGFEQVDLIPSTGLESLNPPRLIEKYGKQITEEQLAQLKDWASKFPLDVALTELEALNPQDLVRDMTQTEDADTIFQEFKEHLASISAWGKVKNTLRENWFILVMSGVAGFAIATTVFMVTGADFRGVIGH